MSRFVSLSGLPIALGFVFLLMAGLTPAPATSAVIPDFSVDGGGWAAANVDLLPPATGPGPVGSDPSHLYIANGGGLQSNFRVADIRNPILQPWAAEQMKKANAEVLAGKIGLTARSSCRPAGVPWMGVVFHYRTDLFHPVPERDFAFLFGRPTGPPYLHERSPLEEP